MDVLPLMALSEEASEHVFLSIGGKDKDGAVVNSSVDRRASIHMEHDCSKRCYRSQHGQVPVDYLVSSRFSHR